MSTTPAPSPAVVRDACSELISAGEAVTFTAVARQTGISRTTLYRRHDLRDVIDQNREPSESTLTLARMTDRIDQLQHALEATAATVRRHEEQIRSLNRIRRVS